MSEIGEGNDYPPYGQQNDEFYTGESERRHFSRDRRQPSVRGGSHGFRPSERRRIPLFQMMTMMMQALS